MRVVSLHSSLLNPWRSDIKYRKVRLITRVNYLRLKFSFEETCSYPSQSSEALYLSPVNQSWTNTRPQMAHVSAFQLHIQFLLPKMMINLACLNYKINKLLPRNDVSSPAVRVYAARDGHRKSNLATSHRLFSSGTVRQHC